MISTRSRLYLTPLDYEKFYENPKYTEIRRSKLVLLIDVLSKYDYYIKLPYQDRISWIETIESSCFNESIRKANKHGIRCAWSNKIFNQIYHGILYNVLMNLDFESVVNSQTLMNNLISGKIELKNVGKLSCKEMCHEK